MNGILVDQKPEGLFSARVIDKMGKNRRRYNTREDCDRIRTDWKDLRRRSAGGERVWTKQESLEEMWRLLFCNGVVVTKNMNTKAVRMWLLGKEAN